MKIFAVGRNYAAHIEELDNERPENPVIFTKPETAILKNNAPFYYPDFSQDIHYEVELLIKINKPGKKIQEKFAHKYFDQMGIGIDFTARDLQQKVKEKRLPWDIAKGFDGSAPISHFIHKDNFALDKLAFHLTVNGEVRQTGNTMNMLFNFNQIIAYISKFFTLKTGDIIFTGTPQGVAPVQVGDQLCAFIENKKMLDFEIR